jgi:uncharacterized protein (DUF1330 family)
MSGYHSCMAAYVIVNIEITDPVRYAEYVQVAGAAVAQYGGEYLARGGRAERLEGEWEPKRLVVLRFDSLERAKDWWSSTEYAGPKALRQSASKTNMIIVDGVAPV